MLEGVLKRVLRAVLGGGAAVDIDLPGEFAALVLALKTAMEAAIDTGTATGGSDTTIVDTGKSFEVNMWEDATYEVEIGAKRYLGIVISNTETTITFAALSGGATVIAGCDYGLKRPVDIADISDRAARLLGVVAVTSGHIHVVSGEVIAKVSGEPVTVSSGAISVVSGHIHVLSGQLIAKISGEAVHVSSGHIHVVSGQVIAKVSGETVIAKISGEAVHVSSGHITIDSGQVIAKISGESVHVSSGHIHVVSGQVIAKVSGETVIAKISGEVVKVSGQTITQASGAVVIAKISGETITQASGAIVIAKISGEAVKVSGQAVKISGQTVTVSSGHIHVVSGQLIAKVSGEAIKVSGETVSIETPTMLKTGPVRTLGSASGGVVLHSGSVKAAVVKALTDNSGVVLVGGSGDRPWYESVGSAQGMVLAAGEAQSKDVSNFDAIYVVAQISGDKVSFDGVN